MAIAHSFGSAVNLNLHGSTEAFALMCFHEMISLSKSEKCWLLPFAFFRGLTDDCALVMRGWCISSLSADMHPRERTHSETAKRSANSASATR